MAKSSETRKQPKSFIVNPVNHLAARIELLDGLSDELVDEVAEMGGVAALMVLVRQREKTREEQEEAIERAVAEERERCNERLLSHLYSMVHAGSGALREMAFAKYKKGQGYADLDMAVHRGIHAYYTNGGKAMPFRV